MLSQNGNLPTPVTKYAMVNRRKERYLLNDDLPVITIYFGDGA